MKLSDHLMELDRAFQLLLDTTSANLEATDLNHHDRHNCSHRVRCDLPWHHDKTTVPRHVPTYTPLSPMHPDNKLLLIKLAAFEATYHNALAPMSPDMVPLVIDTGASISITPYKTDFIGHIHATQPIEIKGITSGLQVQGYGTVCYTFQNDNGTLQTLNLTHCLYVPHCTARLICPRQLGIESKNPLDGYNSVSRVGILTYQGQQTTISCDTTSQLPILYTTPGINTFSRFCATMGSIIHPNSPTSTPFSANLTAGQHKKLQLHERCAHVNWDQLNWWIRQGLLPCEPSNASEPDSVCATCQFGKAHKRSHKADTSHIDHHRTSPGDGVSSDGMEAGCPLIYNPTTTHITPQYHIVFDEGFTSVSTPTDIQNKSFFQDLYQKASWLHTSHYTCDDNEYFFDYLWIDPPLVPRPEARGRKCKHLTYDPQHTNPANFSNIPADDPANNPETRGSNLDSSLLHKTDNSKEALPLDIRGSNLSTSSLEKSSNSEEAPPSDTGVPQSDTNTSRGSSIEHHQLHNSTTFTKDTSPLPPQHEHPPSFPNHNLLTHNMTRI